MKGQFGATMWASNITGRHTASWWFYIPHRDTLAEVAIQKISVSNHRDHFSEIGMTHVTSFAGSEEFSSPQYVVYDARNGDLIHIHHFVGQDPCASEEGARAFRERMALQEARKYCRGVDLRVHHAPAGFQLQPGTICRVEPARNTLITLPEPEESYCDLGPARK